MNSKYTAIVDDFIRSSDRDYKIYRLDNPKTANNYYQSILSFIKKNRLKITVMRKHRNFIILLKEK